MDASSAQLRIVAVKDLPALPSAAQLLIQVLSDEDVPVERVVALIEKMPGLAARLAGMANSAYFGHRGRMCGLSDAVTVLGLRMVRNLALTLAVGDVLDTRACRNFDPERYWRHALACALTARQLAPLMPPESRPTPDGAYLCGLLHNLGVMLLAHLYPEEMSGLFRAAAPVAIPAGTPAALAHPGALTTGEKSVLGVDHHQAAGFLMRRWQLPEETIAVAERWRDPPRPDAGTRLHAGMVALIRFSADWSAAYSESWTESELPPFDPDGLALLGIAEAKAGNAQTRLVAPLAELGGMVEVIVRS